MAEERNASKVKRVFIGLFLGFIVGFFIIGFWILKSTTFTAPLSLFAVFFLIGYSSWGSNLFLGFWQWGKEERAKNRAIREQDDTVSREEYSRERGRLKAQQEYGYPSSSNEPISISIRQHHHSGNVREDNPFVLGRQFKEKMDRAGERYKQADRDMRRKIW